MSIRVLCLRHAESENVVARAAGALPTAALTPRGRRQAAQAAHVLRDERITHIYASTALRAQQTADIIADHLNVQTTPMPELVEVDIGHKEGATDPSTAAETAKVLHSWVINKNLTTQVANGETGHEVVARITRAFTTITSAHPTGTVVLIGHVASLTAGLSALCSLPTRIWGAPLPPAIPFPVEWDGHTWHCETWPGLPHKEHSGL
jgi:alpha-ribazole phosphatase/probable phosphoglycerate mutase